MEKDIAILVLTLGLICPTSTSPDICFDVTAACDFPVALYQSKSELRRRTTKKD